MQYSAPSYSLSPSIIYCQQFHHLFPQQSSVTTKHFCLVTLHPSSDRPVLQEALILWSSCPTRNTHPPLVVLSCKKHSSILPCDSPSILWSSSPTKNTHPLVILSYKKHSSSSHPILQETLKTLVPLIGAEWIPSEVRSYGSGSMAFSTPSSLQSVVSLPKG